jgi:hypothetical protein
MSSSFELRISRSASSISSVGRLDSMSRNVAAAVIDEPVSDLGTRAPIAASSSAAPVRTLDGQLRADRKFDGVVVEEMCVRSP